MNGLPVLVVPLVGDAGVLLEEHHEAEVELVSES
jgi:hypothetical protein